MASSSRAALAGALLLVACHKPAAPVAVAPVAPPAPVVVDAGVPASAATDAPVHQVLESIIIKLNGSAQVQRAGSDEWVELKIGDPVRPGDTVRTASDSEVSLGFGTAQLHLHDESSVKLKILGANRVRAEVAGQVEAAAPDASEQVELEGPGGALATVRFGRAMMHAEGGRSAVASLEGKLALESGGSQVDLEEGAFSVAQDGRAPSRGIKAPKRAALEVAWPAQALTNKATLKLQGRAGPWTRVFVQGHAVQPADDGNFTSDVALHRGEQRVRVVAVDVLGHRTAKSMLITLDPDAPNIHAEVRFR
jgi:hypothetical protein